MAKPIFIIGLSKDYHPESIERIRGSLEIKMNDYHVLIHITNADETTFQIFYEKDFTHIKYEELKQIIEKEVINASNKV